MNEKNVKIGFDRFLALGWADYTLDLFLNSKNDVENYQLLKSFLQKEIPGTESARKTSNQLKRLWLNDEDECQNLRLKAAIILNNKSVVEQSIFHLGMAINVFPVFKETCRKIGELSTVQHIINKNNLIDRVSQTFLNPSSIPRIVSRVIQTLNDWKLIYINQSDLRIREIAINDPEISAWLIQALMIAQHKQEIPLTEINAIPEKLGVKIVDPRQLVQRLNGFAIRRNSSGVETVIIC